MTKEILIIDHKFKGCSNNIRALAAAIARKHEGVTINVINTHIRDKTLIPLLRLTMNPRMRTLLEKMPQLKKSIYHFFFDGYYPETKKYTAIISTLGPGEAPAAFLAYHTKSPSLHIGTPKRMPRKFFDVIIANPGIAAHRDEIELELPPTRLMPETIKDSAERFLSTQPAPHHFHALLIGGTAADVHYDDTVWQNLYSFMHRHAQSTGCRWLVSTSRRTPESVIKKIQDMSAHDNGASIAAISVFTGAIGEVSLLPEFLSVSRMAFVTAESVSMLGDAMACEIPVVALSAPGLIRNDRIQGFLDKQVKAGHLHLIELGTPNAEAHIPNENEKPQRKHWADYFWQHLQKRGNIFT